MFCSVCMGIDIVVQHYSCSSSHTGTSTPHGHAAPQVFLQQGPIQPFSKARVSPESSNTMSRFQIQNAASNHSLLEIIHYKTIVCIFHVVRYLDVSKSIKQIVI